jgi:hypothetical protein
MHTVTAGDDGGIELLQFLCDGAGLEALLQCTLQAREAGSIGFPRVLHLGKLASPWAIC